MKEKLLNDSINLRLHAEDKYKFIDECYKCGIPWQIVVRNIILSVVNEKTTVETLLKRCK